MVAEKVDLPPTAVVDQDHRASLEETFEHTQTVFDVVPKLDKPWFRYGYLLRLNLLMVGAILCNITSGYDGSMMNGLQSLPSWRESFGTPTGSRLGTMSNGTTIGGMIVVPFVSYIAEYFGRRPTLILGCLFIVLGAALQAAAKNFSMFVGSRIIIGVGTGLCTSIAPVYLAECAYPTHRPYLTSIYQCGWPFGSFLAALVTWGPYNSSMRSSTWAWRLPSLLQGFFPVIQIAMLIFGPESPRWLISKGKYEKALEFFTKSQGGGDPSSALVQFQMAECSATIEAEKVQKMSRWTEWFASKAMLHRLFLIVALPIFIQLCGNAIVSYYLHLLLTSVGITSALTQLKLNIGINAYGLAWDMVFANIVPRARRRVLIIVGFLSCCLCYTIFTIISGINTERNFKDKGLAYGAVVMIFMFQGVYHIAAPVGNTYCMEVCPFSLRAKGGVIYGLASSAIGFFNNYVNPIAMAAIDWKYYIVYDVWLVVQAAVVYFFFPETYGLGLEEVARVFGDEVVRGSDTADRFRQLNAGDKIEVEHVA